MRANGAHYLVDSRGLLEAVPYETYLRGSEIWGSKKCWNENMGIFYRPWIKLQHFQYFGVRIYGIGGSRGCGGIVEAVWGLMGGG